MPSLKNRFFNKKLQSGLTSPAQDENAPATPGDGIRADPLSLNNSSAAVPKRTHLDVPQFLVGLAQSVGVQRDSNEDALFSLTTNVLTNENQLQFGLYIVADGMGGHENGEIASSIAVEKLTAQVLDKFLQPLFTSAGIKLEFSIQEIMHSGLLKAHETIKKETLGGGSTLTAALILGEQMTLAHVGDSRAYLVSPGGNLQAITEDHSMVKRLVEIGQISPEEASTHPQRNVLYRALGQGEPFESDIATYQLQPGSQVVLCSDGLWGVISEKQLLDQLMATSEPQLACQSLVDLANSSGGPDNISVIIIRIPE